MAALDSPIDSPDWTLDALALDKAINAAQEELAALKRESSLLHVSVQRLQEIRATNFLVRTRLYRLEVQRDHCSNADDSAGQ